MRWHEFLPWFIENWHAGEHMALVAMTQSGKTTFARQVLRQGRDFVVVFGTKVHDDALYKPLEHAGFVRKSKWNPWEWEDTGERYVIFAPPLKISETAPTPKEVTEALAEQAHAFRTAMLQIFAAGGWCIYCDEIRYLEENLQLAQELNLLYLQGASNDVTIVAAMQRPRSVLLNALQMATWFIVWNMAEREDRARIAEFAGSQRAQLYESAALLPRYEFIALDKVDKDIVRSRVEL